MENNKTIAYKAETRNQMIELLVAFFREEQNNRITSNNIDGLTLKISALLKQNEFILKSGEEQHDNK